MAIKPGPFINCSILSGRDQGRGLSSENEPKNNQLFGSACVEARRRWVVGDGTGGGSVIVIM
jgi:hypothetical protein